ncbi:hypothetical protein TKK_0010146 [Trichogramma kaykai]
MLEAVGVELYTRMYPDNFDYNYLDEFPDASSVFNNQEELPIVVISDSEEEVADGALNANNDLEFLDKDEDAVVEYLLSSEKDHDQDLIPMNNTPMKIETSATPSSASSIHNPTINTEINNEIVNHRRVLVCQLLNNAIIDQETFKHQRRALTRLISAIKTFIRINTNNK